MSLSVYRLLFRHTAVRVLPPAMEKAPVPPATAGRSASSGVSRTAFGDGTELARLDDRPGHRAYHRGRIDERMIEVENPNDLTEGINPSAGSEMPPPPRPGNLWGRARA